MNVRILNKSNNKSSTASRPRYTFKDRKIIVGTGVSIAVFLILAVALARYSLVKEEILERQNMVNSLKVVLRTTQEGSQLWHSTIQRTIEKWAADPEVVRETHILLSSSREKEELLKEPALRRFRDLMRPLIEIIDGRGVFLIAPDYISIASMRDSNIGQINIMKTEWPEIIERIFAGETAIIPPVPAKVPLPDDMGIIQKGYPTMFIGTPVRDWSGNVIAVFTLRLDPVTIFNRIAAASRLGETGETYFFDAKGRLLTHSRYVPELRQAGLIGDNETEIFRITVSDPGIDLREKPGAKPLRPMPFTAAVQGAIKRDSGYNFEGYNNYLGRRVLGAWVWDSTFNIGMVSEFAEDELLNNHLVYTNRMIWGLVEALLALSLVLLAATTYFRSKAGKDLQKLYLAVESSSVPIVITDVDQVVEYSNTAFTEVLGYSSTEIKGLKAKVWSSDLTPRNTREALNSTIYGGNTWKGDMAAETKDGKTIWIDATITPVFNSRDDVTHFVGVMPDVSARRQAEQNLLAIQEQLIQTSKMKDDFLANINHELRTPLNAITGMAALLAKTETNPQQQEYLSKLDGAAIKLRALVYKLLDFSALEKGNLILTISTFRLQDLLNSIIKEFRPTAQQKDIELALSLSSDLPERVHGDRQRIREVLSGLVDNALKFTQEGKVTVEIQCDYGPQEKLTITCRIQDTGIGMTPSQIERAFKVFTQGDESSTRAFGGTGFGLAYCQCLARFMDGDIQVESTPGSGSTFILTFVVEKEKDSVPVQQDDEFPSVESAVPADHQPTGRKDSEIAQVDWSLYQDTFATLYSLLDNHDMEAFSLISTLSQQVNVESDVLEKVSQCIQQYRFEEAKKIIAELQATLKN